MPENWEQELRDAGWTAVRLDLWRSPHGDLYRGPYRCDEDGYCRKCGADCRQAATPAPQPFPDIWLRGRMTHLSFSITGNDHALFDEYHDVEASLQSYRERAIEDAVDLARVPQLSPSAEMPACEQLEKVVDLQKRQFNDYVERNGNG